MQARHLVLRLLFDCDTYLARQRLLLDQAAAHGLSEATLTEMEAAAEHLTNTVVTTWQEVCMDMAGQVGQEMCHPCQPPADPGLDD